MAVALVPLLRTWQRGLARPLSDALAALLAACAVVLLGTAWLLGMAKLLSLTQLDDTRRRHVEVFCSAGRSLSALLDELLDLSRIESGRVDLRPASFDLAVLLETQMALFRPRAETNGLRFELLVPPGLPTVVLGDAQPLRPAATPT